MTNIQRYNEELAAHREETGNAEVIGTEAELTEAFRAYEKPKLQKKLLLIAMIAISTAGSSFLVINEGFEYTILSGISAPFSRLIDGLQFLGALVSFPVTLPTALLFSAFTNLLNGTNDSSSIATSLESVYWSILPFLVGLFWSGVATVLVLKPRELFKRRA